MLFFLCDLAEDVFRKNEFGSPHFVIEAAVFAAVSWALLVSARELRDLHGRLAREKERNDLLSAALIERIETQMDRWGLTPSEKHVAWLIIKGFRFSEIARLRGVKESTTRLQAVSLYAKAEVSGRAEFVGEIIQPFLSPASEDA